jgi:CheY-like chemotaxis protein
MLMNTGQQAGRQPQILAIDDEPEILNIVQILLTGKGYRVLTAGGAEEGLQIFERQPQDIDLVLLDYLMPEMTGDLVFEAIRQIKPDARVLLLTGYDNHVAERLFAQGLRGYVHKPFSLDDLLRVIREQLQP